MMTSMTTRPHTMAEIEMGRCYDDDAEDDATARAHQSGVRVCTNVVATTYLVAVLAGTCYAVVALYAYLGTGV